MAELLLHICCAPDVTVAIERLGRYGRILGFFHNPNIEPYPEYRIREGEARRLAALMDIEYMEDESGREGWLAAVAGFENEPERGERCRRCIRHNLEASAHQAAELGITAFATTLTVSPHKDVDFIHSTGRELGGRYKLNYIDETLRSRGGFQRSVVLSRELGLYRQRYCGCRWSLAEWCRRQDIPIDESVF